MDAPHPLSLSLSEEEEDLEEEGAVPPGEAEAVGFVQRRVVHCQRTHLQGKEVSVCVRVCVCVCV